MSNIQWKITPEEFLREIGLEYHRRGKWLSIRNCIFCSGADYGDSYSLNLHPIDGNFFCHREKSCGQRGSFWKFIEENYRDPKDYLGERTKFKTKGNKFIYGRNDNK